jgi:membrane protein
VERGGWFELVRESVSLWKRHRTSMLASSLAYYAIFSLVPLSVLAIMVLQRAIGDDTMERQLVERARSAGSEDLAVLLEMLLQSVRETLPGVFTAAIGLGTLLFGGSHIFTQLKEALNMIWEVQPKPRRALRNFLISQLVALTIVPVVVLVLVGSLFMDVWLGTLEGPLGILPEAVSGLIFRLLQSVVVFVLLFFLLAAIYKVLPDVNIAWRDVWVGAAATALVLTAGQFAIAAYLIYSDLESVYGLAAWVMFVLIWVYLSAQLLLFGAEFTEVHALRSGAQFSPAEGARPLSDDSPLARKTREDEQTRVARDVQTRSGPNKDVKGESR